MEETGHIEIKIEGKVGNNPLKPKDVDISEVKEMISDIEAFLYPTRAEKAVRPHIAYKLEEGSAKHLFYLPISAVLLFNGLIGEIGKRGKLDFLDYKRAEIIDRIQRKARERNFEITFSNSSDESKTLTINHETNFFNVAADWIETELILYGKINEEGGTNPNFHFVTKEHGKLTISATEKQLTEGEKRLYRIYGVRVLGKQNLSDGKPFDLKLLNYIEYNPVFDKSELDVLIAQAAPNLSKIGNVDTWLNQLRGGANA